VVKLGGSGSFRVSGGVVGRLGFRVGVSASYRYFRRVRNFDFVYTAAVSVPIAYFVTAGSLFISLYMTLSHKMVPLLFL